MPLDMPPPSDTPSGPGSNSGPEITARLTKARDFYERGQGGQKTALHEYICAGHQLIEVKPLLGREFMQRATSQLGVCPQWIYRLMQIARSRDDILAAQKWANANERPLKPKDFSVDGALALVAEMRRAKQGVSSPFEKRSTKPVSRSPDAERASFWQGKFDIASTKLDLANRMIRQLEQMVTLQRSYITDLENDSANYPHNTSDPSHGHTANPNQLTLPFPLPGVQSTGQTPPTPEA